MKGQILILDDNPMDIKVITNVLERSGYACFGFTDHIKANEWLNENTPQIIFLDLQMPTITGYELIPILRQKESLKKVPIIIVSGKNQTEDVIKAIKLGANDYLVKPVDPMILQEKVQKMDAAKSDVFCVDVRSMEEMSVHLLTPIQITSVSEFGLTLFSSSPVGVGDNIEIGSLSAEFFNSSKLLLRCLSCDQDLEKKNYILQMTYVGMTENQRQSIRKNCRQVWVQKKGIA